VKETIPKPLRSLLNKGEGTAVSIYLPLTKNEKSAREYELKRKLVFQKLTPLIKNDSLLEPLKKVLAENEFWKSPQKTLALFSNGKKTEWFFLRKEIGTVQVWVDQEYYIRPLIDSFFELEKMSVLAMSQHSVRLFSLDQGSHQEIELPAEMPRSLDELESFQKDSESLQFNTKTAPNQRGSVRSEGRPANFYESTNANEKKRIWLQRFIQEIDPYLVEFLRESDGPIAFVGVGDLYSVFKSSSQFRDQVQFHVHGSPDKWSENELIQRVFEAMREKSHKDAKKLFQRYQQTKGKLSSEMDKILEAADRNQIEAFFFNDDEFFPTEGHPAEDFHSAEKKNPDLGDADLINLAAVKTLRNGGKAYLVPLHASCFAAIR
jgi:hypothetical protein